MTVSSRAVAVLVLLMHVLAPSAVAAGLGSTGLSLDDFSITAGSGVETAEGLLLTPDASGKIYLTAEPDALDLEQYHLVTFITEAQAAHQTFLLWRTSRYGEQLFQYSIQKDQLTTYPARVDLAGQSRWEGRATMVGLGIFVPAREEVLLRRLRVSSPGVVTEAELLIRNWASYRPWQTRDINVHTGTREFKSRLYPVPVFATLLGVALALYAASLLLRRRLAEFNWQVAGGIVLVCWIALDLLWQTRLYGQVQATLQTFYGKSSQEKLLASEDQVAVRFIDNVRAHIAESDARLFLATWAENNGLLTAYYLAPINTLWRRWGPELPVSGNFRAGDYVLIVRPSSVAYQAESQTIVLSDGDSISVEQLFQDQHGVLLRVL